MAEQPSSPILNQPIPAQIVNEGASFGPLNINEFIESPNAISGKVRFFAELADGAALSRGLICSSDGIISGIPAKGTQGIYEIVIIAENDSGIPFSTQFTLTIKEGIKNITDEYTLLKGKVWDALRQGLPLPDMAELINHPVTPQDVKYLLERITPFIIWDVFNLDPPGTKHLLPLEGVNKHFNIYDCGSCLVGTPKELFSHERTLEDTYQIARIMAREVNRRGWTIELSGIEKVKRAAWIELQHVAELTGKRINIISYAPSEKDMHIYQVASGGWQQELDKGSKPTS